MYPRTLTYEVDASGANAAAHGSGTTVCMYGSDANGRTIKANVVGFAPYVFVRVGDASPETINEFVRNVNDVLIACACLRSNGPLRGAAARAVQWNGAQPVLRAVPVTAVGLKPSGSDRGFSNARAESFIQLFLYAPQFVRVLRDVLEYVYDVRDTRLATTGDVIDTLARALVSGRDTDAPAPVAAAPATSTAEQRALPLMSPSPATSDVDEDSDDDERTYETLSPEDKAIEALADSVATLEVAPPAPDTEETMSDRGVRALDRMKVRRGVQRFQRSLRLSDTAPVEIYEADVDFVVRFLIDAGFKAEECVTINATNVVTTGVNDVTAYEVPWTDVRRCADDRFQNTVPPQVTMSFDCEMETGRGFPNAESESVLQICAVMGDPVADPECAHTVKRAFILKDVELPATARAIEFAPDEIYAFENEIDMITAFSVFVHALQPDVITGYNIEGFDLPYLLQRGEVLGEHETVARITRATTGLARVRDRVFSSSAHGTHTDKEIVAEGLYVYDVYQAIKRSTTFKLRSNKLEYVATKYLGEHKDNVSYDQISTLQETARGRFTLMHYCMKDALLPLRLMGKLTMHLENIEMSRLTGVPLDMICRRGLQIRLKSYLYRVCSLEPTRHLFYTRTNADHRAAAGASYEGAHVETPEVGYHDENVVTLDFNSLYPSIMIAFNLCYKTLIPGNALESRAREFNLDPDSDVWMHVKDALSGVDAADQPRFVRSSHTQGLLPRVCAELLRKRKAVKKQMEAATDEFTRALLNARQLTLKLQANSMYGVTGATTSFGYCPEIAATVTAIGRAVIIESKAIVQAKYTPENGFPFRARVVYGDTDSIFVRLCAPKGGARIATDDGEHTNDSVHWGIAMAAYVTEHFQEKFGRRVDNVLKIVFEKTFSKIIFYAKKRYVGWKHELKFDKKTGKEVFKRHVEPVASGMETERRDSCLLVATAVSTVVTMLLDDNSTRAEALARVCEYIVNDVIGRFESGNVSWHELIQSKQFRKHAAEYRAGGRSPPVHILLAEVLAARFAAIGKGTTYKEGDRVQFVYREATRDGQTTSELGEDPDVAWKAGMRLSRTHYIDNAVKKTMARIMFPVLQKPTRQRTLNDAPPPALTKAQMERYAKRLFDEFLAQAPKRRRHESNHVDGAASTGIAAFVRVKRRRCVLCNVLTTNERICDGHDAAERAADAADRETARHDALTERDAITRTCRACKEEWRVDMDPARAAALPAIPVEEGDIEEVLPCSVNTCDVYWQRRLVDRQVKLRQ